MSSWGFMGTFFGVKGRKVVENVVVAMGENDPDSMNEAQLIEMEKEIDRATQLFARARVDQQREEREAIEAERIARINVAGAEEIQRRLTALPADAPEDARTKLNEAFDIAVTRVEEVQGVAKRERAEADDALAFMTEAEAAVKEITQRVINAKNTLKSKAREMQSAKLQANLATQRADQAADMAGLREGRGTNLTAAVTAFDKSIKASNEKREAAMAKVNAIKGATEKTGDGNPILNDVLRQVGEQGLDRGLPAAERLARLTGKAPPTETLAPPAATETPTNAS